VSTRIIVVGGRYNSGPIVHEALRIDVVIPALDEEAALARVLAALPRAMLRRVVVVDNGSTDRTAAVASGAGAEVVREPRRGYGSACLAGLRALERGTPQPDVVVFLDGDYSDHPEELPRVVEPIANGTADLVVGSRVLGRREAGALLPQARVGNWIASRLLRLLYGVRVSDLGPFRAVRFTSLCELAPSDPDYGFTAEVQVKALRAGLRYAEVPVSYRRRIGRSKITGTLVGSVRAGYKILSTILRHGR
jgi:glycosyltransferase involved in cell wall biosynthesis